MPDLWEWLPQKGKSRRREILPRAPQSHNDSTHDNLVSWIIVSEAVIQFSWQNSRLLWCVIRHEQFPQDDIYRVHRRWSELWGFKGLFFLSELYILPLVLRRKPSKFRSWWDSVELFLRYRLERNTHALFLTCFANSWYRPPTTALIIPSAE